VVSAPIVGATKPHHLTDAIASLDIHLTGDEIARLEAPYAPQPVPGLLSRTAYRRLRNRDDER
jgi:aryl-alcohol dehydrogenase-like predicted oxidoreductase